MEKRIQFREKTLADFSAAHQQSVSRSVELLAKQNEEARLRNIQLLRDVGAAAGNQVNRRRLGSSTRTAEQLNRARESYLSFTEKLLPTWKDHQSQQVSPLLRIMCLKTDLFLSVQREGILRKLAKEKQDTERRREKTLREMHRDRQLDIAVEEERRKLLLALSLEERDRLEAEAEAALLRQQGRVLDQVLQKEFVEFGEEYQRHVESKCEYG